MWRWLFSPLTDVDGDGSPLRSDPPRTMVSSRLFHIAGCPFAAPTTAPFLNTPEGYAAGIIIQPLRNSRRRCLRVTGNAIHVRAAAFCGVTASLRQAGDSRWHNATLPHVTYRQCE